MNMQLFHCLAVIVLFGSAARTKAEQDLSQGRLVLTENNKLECRGCYNFNQSLTLCFNIHPDSIRLATENDITLVSSHQVGKESFLVQIFRERFFSHESRLIAIPDDAPTSPNALLAYLRRQHGPRYELNKDDLQFMKMHYQRALDELRKTPEILLMGLTSAALAHEQPLEDVARFHEMSYGLLKMLDADLPAEFQPVDPQHHRKKRCTDIRTTSIPKCVGMCGPKCRCWSWVCGDCCWNRGCYEHDRCCAQFTISTYCLLPFLHGFSCGSFGGYPRCLSHRLG